VLARGTIVDNTERFRCARDVLVAAGTDYARACREFTWPRFTVFNWAIDWFDAIARDNARTALRVIDEDGSEECLSFDQLRRRSNRIANHLRTLGLGPGDRILLMLGNSPALWEVTLAAMKLRCPLIPATTLLSAAEIRDRMERGQVRAVVTDAGCVDRFEPRAESCVHLLASGEVRGWQSLSAAHACSEEFVADGLTQADELLLLYFTSGTTAKPKLVAHTHVSYPVGHLTTLYWIGLKPGDVHLNLSSAGWAKHAWSCLFAPWNAEATVVAIRSGRFDAARLLATLVRCEVTTFCAPPTVWRALIQQPLKSFDVKLREALSAGEPLNPEVIAQVRDAWGITLRDGYGQTETTLQIGNFPGQPVEAGAMGRPAPGCRVRLLDADGNDAREGEVSIVLGDDPVCLMAGYLDDSERTRQVMQHGCYRTGDVARVGADGRYIFVGRNDDVFKSSDYRISPFELESVLIEHDAVVEAAVVPSPDPQRLCVPKAFVVVAPGWPANAATARSILDFVRARVAPYKRVRRIEFAELPKTISGKIRRVELREAEIGRIDTIRKQREFWEEDLRD
jgi:acetyl-CoA synthetase